MTIISHSPEEYIDLIDDPSKKDAIIRLRQAISASLPLGFEEGIQYNMIIIHVYLMHILHFEVYIF